MDPIFNDKIQFPSFYRTVPDVRTQYKGIVQLLNHFGWTWIGIIAADDGSSQRISIELESEITQSGICLEFSVSVSDNGFKEQDFNAYNTILKSRCNVIIIICDTSVIQHILNVFSKPNIVWIALASFQIITDMGALQKMNGSLIFQVHKGEIPGLKDFILLANPWKYKDNIFFRKIWDEYFSCSFDNSTKCDQSLQAIDPSIFNLNNFRFTFSLYAAVYSVAYALNAMYKGATEKTAGKMNWQPWELNKYLKKVHFKIPGGEEMFFDDKGNAPGRFDVINLFWLPNKTMRKLLVGNFNQDASGTRFFINESAIHWNPQFSQVPRSVCSESCLPGYVKVYEKEKAKCCHNCIPCPEGEITNTTDMESCWRCPEDQWSNAKRNKCILRIIDFLSNEEPLGLTLALMTSVFTGFTAIILTIFVKYKKTPIVKANNLNLSYTLLLSLILSFLCPFLFIGQPTKVSCLLRQVVFGNSFAVGVSCVLAKTVIVIFAFNATKPNPKQTKQFGKKTSSSLVLVCSSGEGIICVLWLLYSPPFLYNNSQVEVGKIIAECKEGSTIAFYLVIGYIGFLALLSFFVAFLVRKLPDTFNEAQYITFSMLIFCSVWISFIPAYLSTKGKYMVVVEIFAILASAAGLLFCIFFPKCYIILIKPELNTRVTLTNERKRKHTRS